MKTLTTLGLLALFASSAQALEPFSTYDNFSSKPLDPALWSSGERGLTIRGRALNLMQRTWGAGNADSGSTFANFNQSLANPAAVTSLKAKVTVNALEVNACAGNPALSQSRARIIGAFFNTGTPTPGSAVGDVLAQIRLTRFSNSTDPAGVLRVQGIASVCSTADCTGTTTIGSFIDLGTVSLGQAATVQMEWDQPNKTFLFARDGGAFSGAVAYTESDTSAPSSPFKQLSTRLDLPSCLGNPRIAGMVDASFDSIAVNQSAAP